MIFQQLLNEESGCLSYLIGCAQAGRAVIVDPGRDRVHDYLRIARKKGLTITDVIETHTHADHISGNRDLGAATKAAIHVHRAAGVTFPHVPLVDGDTLRLGQVELKICHAPGHTPDSICVLVTDHARGTEPWFVLTGDTLFVGSVGRPDLGGVSAAEDLWQSLRRVLQPLPDGVEVYPAHGAGSACGGGAMSAKAASTIGFERRFNPAFRFDDKARFVDFIMQGVPPKRVAGFVTPGTRVVVLAQAPSDVDRAVQALSRVGIDEVVGYLQWGMIDWRDAGLPVESVPQIAAYDLHTLLEADGAVVVDVREPFEWLEGHVPGALHVPMFEAVARASELPADRPKAVVCAGGLRSSTTISALKRRVPGPWLNVTGGMAAWLKAGYGVTRA